MISVYWLVAGALLLALEAFGIPGIGFLFGGIAAILVGILVETGLIPAVAYISQFGVFFLVTSLLTVLLWKKLKTWRMNPGAPQYDNIIGTDAVVSEPLSETLTGTVRWSGTLMRAKRVGGQVGELAIGTEVTVREVHGNVLLVAPK